MRRGFRIRPSILVAIVSASLLLLTAGPYASGATMSDEPPTHDERMGWWREARFGMFIHWGLYAIAAGEWHGEIIPGVGEWIMYTGKIPPDEYRAKLLHRFNPVKFDADEWAQIASDAGIKYLVITTKHHDGFCLFDSEHTDYDIMSTPFQRDIMREIADASRQHDIRVGWYHSILDWSHPDANAENWNAYAQVLRAQVDEILVNYGPIDIMWFDGEWDRNWTEEQGRALYDHIRGISPRTIINNRIGKGRSGMAGLHDPEEHVGDFGTPEQEVPATGMTGYDWETCMTMNDSWGFKKSDTNWKSTEELIQTFVDVASKGGNFLLNVGPTAEGEIPQASVERLAAMGEWMRVNGESIYGTTASPFRRLQWGRCTVDAEQPTRLYLHVFDWPTSGTLVVPGLQNEVEKAFLLVDDSAAPLECETRENEVWIEVGESAPDPYCNVIVLDVIGKPDVMEKVLQQDREGSLTLHAADALVDGHTARYEHGPGKDNIGFWSDPSETVFWEIEISTPGRFDLLIEYACAPGTDGATYEVRLTDESLRAIANEAGIVGDTGAWTRFVRAVLGEITIDSAGRYTLRVIPTTKPGSSVMNLKAVTLTPAAK